MQLSLNYYSLPAVKQNPTPEFEGVKATMPPILQPLTSVPLGGKATVVEIKLPPESRPRLMEMGLLVGTLVELVRFAPLGDPEEIKVRGYHLTLRRHEAEQILVQPNG